MFRVWVLCLQPEPLLGLPSLGKMLLVPVRRGQGPSGQEVTLVFWEGKTATPPALAREQQFSETAQRNPKGGGGFSLPTRGTLSGQKWEPEQDSQREEGALQQDRAGRGREAPPRSGGQGGGREEAGAGLSGPV